RSIQATGIVPDIVIEANPRVAKTAGKSVEAPTVREANLPKHLHGEPSKAGEQAPPPAVPASDQDQGDSPDVAAPSTLGVPVNDPQLARAIEVLRSWQTFKTLVAKNG